MPKVTYHAMGYVKKAAALPSQEAPYNWFWVIILIGIALSAVWRLAC